MFTDAEIARILDEAARLLPHDGLRPITFRTLFALLACTGLRPCEAVRLRRSDVDLDGGSLTIRKTKFGKSRLVPLHASASRALRRYERQRDQHAPQPTGDSFFLIDGGKPVSGSKMRTAFARVRRALGWPPRGGRRMLRLHDLRHSFACRRLIRWHAEKVDVNQRLASLSTFLGHVKVTDTYWYLTGVPELLAVSAARFEQFTPQPIGV